MVPNVTHVHPPGEGDSEGGKLLRGSNNTNQRSRKKQRAPCSLPSTQIERPDCECDPYPQRTIPKRLLLQKIVLPLVLVSTLLLSLAMSGMYVNIRSLERRVSALVAIMDSATVQIGVQKDRLEFLPHQFSGQLRKIEERIKYELENRVDSKLWLRDNDKTGQVDFALQSSGGLVVHTGDTIAYSSENRTLSIFGIPVYTLIRNDPSAILKPDMSPGSCWAFRGSRGVTVISLAAPVRISGVTLEHISSRMSLTGDTSSAPRDFSIHGIKQLQDSPSKYHSLGNFTYNSNGPTLQQFVIKDNPSQSFRYIAFRVSSNHGHPEFTCVYRLRIHGNLDLSFKRRAPFLTSKNSP